MKLYGKIKKRLFSLYFAYLVFRCKSFGYFGKVIHIESVQIYLVNFRLGEEIARIYEEFEVNTSKIKSSQRIEMTIENKRKKGVIYAEEISQSCTEIINSISNVFKREQSQKIESIGRLRNNLFLLERG